MSPKIYRTFIIRPFLCRVELLEYTVMPNELLVLRRKLTLVLMELLMYMKYIHH